MFIIVSRYKNQPRANILKDASVLFPSKADAAKHLGWVLAKQKATHKAQVDYFKHEAFESPEMIHEIVDIELSEAFWKD
jgi:hypothetical protein